jgi:copper chaperone
MEKVTLNVKGMTCGHCEKAVRTALEDLNGIGKVAVNLKEGKVDVEFDSGKVSNNQMKEAIEDQGYDVV